MNLWLGLLIGFKEIWAHKFRSFLTMLGVILGVASLLSMFSLTAGIAKGMREYMEQIGGIERVGVTSQDVPEDQLALADISPGRTMSDAEAIAKSASLVSAVTPVSELSPAAITRGTNTMRGQVSGCWPDFVEINKHIVASGRNLSWLDVERAHSVCVIGTRVVDELWPDQPNYDPLGETIMVNAQPFTVVGVFDFYERDEDKRRRELGLPATPGSGRGPRPRGARGGGGPGRGWNPFERKNSTVIIPISTMLFQFKSANVVGEIDQGTDS
jgi:putative ABC transport system permease protein